MYYDNNFPYGRMRETPAVRPYENPMLLMEDSIVPISGGEAIYRATPDDALKSPLPLDTPDVIDLGKTLYVEFCQQCHGKYHDGNGTVGQSFAPLPTDIRSPKVQEYAPGTLFKHIAYGVKDGRQPALATTITPNERWHIVAYVKSLGVRP